LVGAGVGFEVELVSGEGVAGVAVVEAGGLVVDGRLEVDGGLVVEGASVLSSGLRVTLTAVEVSAPMHASSCSSKSALRFSDWYP
jgi:phage baseplate assembly protein gpV